MKITKDEALNIATQCRATAGHPLTQKMLVDGGNGLMSELLNDAARVIEALAQPPLPVQPVAWAVVGDGKFGKYEIGRETETNFSVCKYWLNRGYDLVPLYTAPPLPEERNFCPRCGKRTADIHTCTPPQENT